MYFLIALPAVALLLSLLSLRFERSKWLACVVFAVSFLVCLWVYLVIGTLFMTALLAGLMDVAALIAIVRPLSTIRLVFPAQSQRRKNLESKRTDRFAFWEWRLCFLLVILLSLRVLVPAFYGLFVLHRHI